MERAGSLSRWRGRTKQEGLMSGTQSRRPQVGLHYFATDRSLPVADFARAAAGCGFDAVLLPEHTHIPVSTPSPYPDGGDLPERYRRTLDPYVALAVVAAQTDLTIGTCVSLVAQHDPIALAKTVATLDFLSGGRFSLGVGFRVERARTGQPRA
jgi:alkanesulfonate monooxygenase SsuD/methylene tetrahydromethanopterin reductase-like flavin-dependent oxidoreductase (luciferase family)